MASIAFDSLQNQGHDHASGENGLADQLAAVSITEHPIFTPRKLRVVCIGAGFSGLVLSHRYNYIGNHKDYADLVIYEKNHDVGGTWLENRYPGVACDVCSLSTMYNIHKEWDC